MASFEAIEHRHAAGRDLPGRGQAAVVAAAVRLRARSATASSARCGSTCCNQGIAEGYFRPDLDVDLVYRFIRDTTWVSVRWYQPGGPLTAEQVGRQYLRIVLGGITATEGV